MVPHRQPSCSSSWRFSNSVTQRLLPTLQLPKGCVVSKTPLSLRVLMLDKLAGLRYALERAKTERTDVQPRRAPVRCPAVLVPFGTSTICGLRSRCCRLNRALEELEQARTQLRAAQNAMQVCLQEFAASKEWPPFSSAFPPPAPVPTCLALRLMLGVACALPVCDG